MAADFEKAFRDMEAGMRKLEKSMGLLDKSGFDENGDINLSPDDLLDREIREMEEEDKSLLDNLRDHISGTVSSVVSRVATEEETNRLRAELEEMRDELNRMRFSLKHPSGRPPPPKPQMPPNTPASPYDPIKYSGTSSVQVGRSRQLYANTLREYEPNTDTTLLIEYDDEFTFRANIDCGALPSISVLRRKIMHNIRRKNNPSLEEQASEFIKRRRTKKSTSDINQQIVDRMCKRHRDESPSPRKNGPSDITDVVTELHEHTEFMKGKFASIFRRRKFFGGRGDYITFEGDPKVIVSSHNIFGRKYSLKVNDIMVHVPDLEMHMEYCDEGDKLELYMEMRTDDEKVVLTKLINSLIALDIAEPHHLKIKELL